VRGFDDPNVVHVSAEIDPREDIEIINIELALADMAQLERKIGKLESDIKGDKKLIPTFELAKSLRDHLALGKPVLTHLESDSVVFEELVREMRFLTAKPVIFAVNVDEAGLAKETTEVHAVRQIAADTGAEVVVLCAKLEEEMLDMTPEEQREFLELAGAEASGLDQVVGQGFMALGLISYFTKNEKEVRAWNIPVGTKAPQAAGKIHTDFEHGFIRAEVVPFDVFEKYGSDAAVRAAGLMRSEGKEYIVQDGDVILFRFNV
jgi:GTP-binding protein YchF